MTGLTREAAEAAAERLKVYGQPQRLMILSSLLAGERTVGDIEAVTAIGQPALSQQLAELRRAQMVLTRRVAKQVFYQLADEKVVLCVRAIVAMFGPNDADAAPAPRVPAGSPRPVEQGAAMFARVRP
jgi:DNA-binding transcriptional ArsR family regulator